MYTSVVIHLVPALVAVVPELLSGLVAVLVPAGLVPVVVPALVPASICSFSLSSLA